MPHKQEDLTNVIVKIEKNLYRLRMTAGALIASCFTSIVAILWLMVMLKKSLFL